MRNVRTASVSAVANLSGQPWFMPSITNSSVFLPDRRKLSKSAGSEAILIISSISGRLDLVMRSPGSQSLGGILPPPP